MKHLVLLMAVMTSVVLAAPPRSHVWGLDKAMVTHELPDTLCVYAGKKIRLQGDQVLYNEDEIVRAYAGSGTIHWRLRTADGTEIEWKPGENGPFELAAPETEDAMYLSVPDGRSFTLVTKAFSSVLFERRLVDATHPIHPPCEWGHAEMYVSTH